MSKPVDKLTIADQMLETSIEEFIDKGRFFSAFNLAGVSEELYGKYVRISGGKDTQQEDIEAIFKIAEQLGFPEQSVREWKKVANYMKNAVKHFDSEADRHIEIAPEDEARLMITAALSNHSKLGREVTPIIQRFNEYGHEKALAMMAEQGNL